MRGSFTLIIYHLLGKKTKKQIKKSCIFIFCRNASVLFVTLFWYLVIWADQSSLKSVPSRDIQYLSGIKRQSDAEFDDRCLRCLCPATVYQWHFRTSPNLNLITGYHRVHFVLSDKLCQCNAIWTWKSEWKIYTQYINASLPALWA